MYVRADAKKRKLFYQLFFFFLPLTAIWEFMTVSNMYEMLPDNSCFLFLYTEQIKKSLSSGYIALKFLH